MTPFRESPGLLKVWLPVLVGVALVAPRAHGFQLERHAFSGGGFRVSGGSFRLSGTIAEAGVVGSGSNGTFSMSPGFWLQVFRSIATDAPEEVASTVQWVNSLRANMPNPFRGSTTIGFTAAQASAVKLVVYDVTGRRVATLVNELRDPGNHRIHWEGRDESGRLVASGVYFYRLDIGSWSETRKMLKLR